MPVVQRKTFKFAPMIKPESFSGTTRSLCLHLQPEQEHMAVDEYSPENWAIGGQFRSEKS